MYDFFSFPPAFSHAFVYPLPPCQNFFAPLSPTPYQFFVRMTSFFAVSTTRVDPSFFDFSFFSLLPLPSLVAPSSLCCKLGAFLSQKCSGLPVFPVLSLFLDLLQDPFFLLSPLNRRVNATAPFGRSPAFSTDGPFLLFGNHRRFNLPLGPRRTACPKRPPGSFAGPTHRSDFWFSDPLTHALCWNCNLTSFPRSRVAAILKGIYPVNLSPRFNKGASPPLRRIFCSLWRFSFFTARASVLVA